MMPDSHILKLIFCISCHSIIYGYIRLLLIHAAVNPYPVNGNIMITCIFSLCSRHSQGHGMISGGKLWAGINQNSILGRNPGRIRTRIIKINHYFFSSVYGYSTNSIICILRCIQADFRSVEFKGGCIPCCIGFVYSLFIAKSLILSAPVSFISELACFLSHSQVIIGNNL